MVGDMWVRGRGDIRGETFFFFPSLTLSICTVWLIFERSGGVFPCTYGGMGT